MQYFTKRIEVNRRFFGFYFNRIYTVEVVRYHESVVDKDRKANSFNMKELNGRWVIVNPESYPEWIVQLESQLSSVILENKA